MDYQHARTLLLISMVLSLLVGVVVTWWLVRSIVRPLGDAVRIAQTVASGDLRSEVLISGKDETAQLLRALKEMNDNLAGIVSEVRLGTGTQQNAALVEQAAAAAESLQDQAETLNRAVAVFKLK